MSASTSTFVSIPTRGGVSNPMNDHAGTARQPDVAQLLRWLDEGPGHRG
jgi:hypothetical protein